MSNDRFRNAVGHINEQLLERCEKYDQQLSKKRRLVLHWTAAAACLAVVIGILAGSLGSKPTSVSGAEIAAMFPGSGGTSEMSCKAVYVPEESFLEQNRLPGKARLPVYGYWEPQETVSEESFSKFADSILAKLAKAMDAEVPEYEFNNYSSKLTMDTAVGNHGVSASQYGYLNFFGISRFPQFSGEETTLTLDGKLVQVDQSQSDEQIIESLKEVRKSLLDIFGVNFPDVKIVRSYEGESEYGAVVLLVYLYDKNAHPLNSYMDTPYSDSIELWFYNNPVFMEELCSETVLQYVDISYRQWRADAEKMYYVDGAASRISLREAEALLKKGYYFGKHSCYECNPGHGKVDFADYDHVSFTYLFKSRGIPFYVFYKQCGSAQNGNAIYARVYVPAIAVEGLEDCFKKQDSVVLFD